MATSRPLLLKQKILAPFQWSISSQVDQMMAKISISLLINVKKNNLKSSIIPIQIVHIRLVDSKNLSMPISKVIASGVQRRLTWVSGECEVILMPNNLECLSKETPHPLQVMIRRKSYYSWIIRKFHMTTKIMVTIKKKHPSEALQACIGCHWIAILWWPIIERGSTGPRTRRIDSYRPSSSSKSL